jgi:hypothetical protein
MDNAFTMNEKLLRPILAIFILLFLAAVIFAVVTLWSQTAPPNQPVPHMSTTRSTAAPVHDHAH